MFLPTYEGDTKMLDLNPNQTTKIQVFKYCFYHCHKNHISQNCLTQICSFLTFTDVSINETLLIYSELNLTSYHKACSLKIKYNEESLCQQ